MEFRSQDLARESLDFGELRSYIRDAAERDSDLTYKLFLVPLNSSYHLSDLGDIHPRTADLGYQRSLWKPQEFEHR